MKADARARVVRIIARLNVGGPAQHVILLTESLADRYPTVLVAGSVDESEADMSSLAQAHGVPVVGVPELGRAVHPFDDVIALWKVWRLCRRLRPQVVHTHTAKAGAVGRLAAWLAGVPVLVHTYHGHVFRGYFSPAVTKIFLFIERALARITTAVIAISPRQAEELAEYLRIPEGAIRVVPLGLDLERLLHSNADEARRRFRAAIGADDSRVVIVTVGRLTGIKNHSLALRAVARVASRRPELLYVLVGGGADEPALRAQVESLGIGDSVRFAGWWDDLAAVYHGADAVALTSDNEGTPVCLIEALACGRPVVATAVGGVPDVLEEGAVGRLVPKGDTAALATALDELCDPAERKRWTDMARERTIQRYGIARLTRDVAALYDELLASAGISPPAAA